MTIDLYANEVVTKAGDAQYIFIDKQIKGKLILTNQRIYFKALNETKVEHNMEIEPKDIQELLYFKTKMFIQNGINVVTKEGKELKFLVKNRNSWTQMINKMY